MWLACRHKSALGQKRKWPHVDFMSGLPPKADIPLAADDVRFVPGADIALLVGAVQSQTSAAI